MRPCGLEEGFWPIPIHPWNSGGQSPGKRPIGRAWGVDRPTEKSLRAAFRRYPEAGVGLKLGSEGGVIDIDIDAPELAAEALARMFTDGEPRESLGWRNSGTGGIGSCAGMTGSRRWPTSIPSSKDTSERIPARSWATPATSAWRFASGRRRPAASNSRPSSRRREWRTASLGSGIPPRHPASTQVLARRPGRPRRCRTRPFRGKGNG